MVAGVLADVGVNPDAVREVAATVGPGSFMGVRVGISFAKGFASARHLPTRPVSVFDALAHTHGEAGVAVVIDARRGQVYAKGFGDKVFPAQIFDIETAVETLGGYDMGAVIGSGAPLLRPGAVPMPETPSVLGLVHAAEVSAPGPLEPEYLRPPDAAPAKAVPSARQL